MYSYPSYEGGYPPLNTACTLNAMFTLAISYIFSTSSPIQPYQSVLTYFQLRSSQAKFLFEPLFIDDYNKPVTCFWFQRHLKSILQQSGNSAQNFSSHSFRIRAATLAAQKRSLRALVSKSSGVPEYGSVSALVSLSTGVPEHGSASALVSLSTGLPEHRSTRALVYQSIGLPSDTMRASRSALIFSHLAWLICPMLQTLVS